jgi:hypothetical protein
MLNPLPISFGHDKRGPWYVLHHAAIAANCGDGAIPLVSSREEEINGLGRTISQEEE